MTEHVWLEKESLLLIDLYKNLPNLWNPKHPDYKRRDVRRNGLTKISEQLDISKDEIERKLKNLTSHFWRENRKMNKKRSRDVADDVYSPKWFAFKSLEFLKEKIDGHTSKDTEGSNDASECIETDDFTTVIDEVSDSSSDSSSKSPRPTSPSPPTQQLPLITESTPSKNKLKRKSKPDVQLEPEICGVVRGRYTTSNERDEFTVLGEEVEISVRQLKSSYAQKTVKHKIQSLLYEASLGYYDQLVNPSQLCQSRLSRSPESSYQSTDYQLSSSIKSECLDGASGTGLPKERKGRVPRNCPRTRRG